MRLLLDTCTFLWLVAHALLNGLTIVTSDPVIPRYPVRTLW
jgi:PIN domain nuclease of toxin-antitoxin system